MRNKIVLTDEELHYHQGQHLNTMGPRDVQIASCIKAGRAIEAAVLESEEVQNLRNMLYEARCQLPLAAQFWNEDDKKDRSNRNVQHVLGLIKRIDAALEKQ